MDTSTYILDCTHVSKTFGKTHALSDAELHCKEGEVHCILGENGAGKSTLIKILCGVHKPDPGAVIKLDGKEISFSSPSDAAAHGIVAVFQELSIISGITVAENIFLGVEPRRKNHLIDYEKMNQEALRIMEYVGISGISPTAMAGRLSLAERQLLEVCKAVAKKPRIIIFDEATSALSKKEVQILFTFIKKLKSEGVTSLFISHRMEELAQIVDGGSVYRDSHYIASFEWGKVSEQQILNWIVGREVRDIYPPRNKVTTDEIALSIRHLSMGKKVRDVSIDVRKGEILGIAGLQGHGQTEFLYTIFGNYKDATGEIKVNGEPAKIKGIPCAIQKGLSLVPEERKLDGLMLERSILENMTLMTLKKHSRGGVLDRKCELKSYADMQKLMQIKAASPDTLAGELSGGNQQKIVIAKALLTDAPIILLADPTRGIDIGAKLEIYRVINELAADGKAVIYYSTELSELIYLANRVAVFVDGRIAAVLEEDEISDMNVMKYAMGAATVTKEGGQKE